MKINFVSQNPDLNRGSFRIWIHDLCYYLNNIGVDANINYEGKDSDVVIFDKSFSYVKKIDGIKVGYINPVGFKKHNADFIIAGSLEEKDSLLCNDNVFLFPLIEKMYQNCMLKIHKKTDKIKICFHGSSTHLYSFDSNLKNALEELYKSKNIELVVIQEKSIDDWVQGRPNIPIKFLQWNIKTVLNDIMSCDIGICPNVTEPMIKPHDVNIPFGLYDTDYLLRFKNKSNAGRAFVFHQLGIPVVADLTPSNFHILGNPDNGYIAMSQHGWLKSLQELTCENKRSLISFNAKKEFNRCYNPNEWAKRLYKSIEKI